MKNKKSWWIAMFGMWDYDIRENRLRLYSDSELDK